MIDRFETFFKDKGLKVAYVNMTYKITDLVKSTQQLRTLFRQKATIKLAEEKKLHDKNSPLKRLLSLKKQVVDVEVSTTIKDLEIR